MLIVVNGWEGSRRGRRERVNVGKYHSSPGEGAGDLGAEDLRRCREK